MPGWVDNASGLWKERSKLKKDKDRMTAVKKVRFALGTETLELMTITGSFVGSLQGVKDLAVETKTHQKRLFNLW